MFRQITCGELLQWTLCQGHRIKDALFLARIDLNEGTAFRLLPTSLVCPKRHLNELRPAAGTRRRRFASLAGEEKTTFCGLLPDTAAGPNLNSQGQTVTTTV
jgi:hypothetical protein